LAAMFTVAWMQRSNELLPQLSAGVSTRRVVRPVLVTSCVLLGLSVANQELIIPSIADTLLRNRDDPEGKRDLAVRGAFEPNGIHISGKTASREGLVVREFLCNIPETLAGGNVLVLRAEEARYVPPGEARRSGGWLLSKTKETADGT